MQIGEPRHERVAGREGFGVLGGREPGADHRARHVEPRGVRQYRPLAKRAAGLGNGPAAEGRELLVRQPVEVHLGSEVLGARQGDLDLGEDGVERADGGARVDVDDGRRALRQPVADRVAHPSGAAVHREDHRATGVEHGSAHRVDVVGEGDPRPVRLDGLQPGKGSTDSSPGRVSAVAS